MSNLDPHGQPFNVRFNRARQAERDLSELLGLAKGLLADGAISEEEALLVTQWVVNHPAAVEQWPVNLLAEGLQRIFSDGRVDNVEREELAEILARSHLGRVQGAWTEPTDWTDLSIYGFYCLEAAVEAAALHVGIHTSKKHWEKVDSASELHQKHGLPDVTEVLRDLNDARKAAAYGDVDRPELDAEQLAAEIERYVDAVAALLGEA